MEQRVLGGTGRSLSVLGFGGVLLIGLDQPAADALVSEAVDHGVTYFDVAPSYGSDQETEKRLGPALRPYRASVFLACKTGDRTAAGARSELERSLKHLETDHFDLFQLHAISSVEEVDAAFATGGAMEALVEARAAGMVRHVGFSAHSAEAALAAMERFEFDSVLFPVNYVTWFAGAFGPQIMAMAQERGVARLALKGMASTVWPDGADRTVPNLWYKPITDRRTADLALRWTLSQPITAAIPPGNPELFRLALQIANQFRPIAEDEIETLRTLAALQQPIFRAA